MPTGGLNLFGLHQFDYKDSFFNGQAILSQGAGYGVVVGYGVFFVVITMVMTLLDRKFGGTKNTSEEFNTAGRSIKTGLVAVDVVSRWTWVATLLVAANEAYLYGISGAFWYGSAATIQLFLFGILVVELKRKAPVAHTVIELVHLRWGKFASFVFLYLCYLNNVIVCVLLFIGAGNVLSAVTGMNIYAALVLIPLGVVVYTCTGGLKATFTSSYIHTVIIFITVNIFVYTVYASNKEPIGSMGKVWENLKVVSTVTPVKGNKGGSYLTMLSKTGLEFGVWNLLSVFGTLFADQAYWQGAIAASPKAAYRGYILGGLLWFPIPFAFATAMGLAALALDLPLSTGEFNDGLITVAVAQYLLGKGGVVLILTIVFMSATSSGSAEFMSMSSLWTYDVYKRYINPKATNKQLLLISRAAVVVSGLLMAGIACVCKVTGIDVNFLFFVGGLLVSSAFPPLALMITWQAVPAGAAISAALGGQALSIAAWLGHTQIIYGRMTVSDTLQRLGPALDGTLVAILASVIICVLWTLVAPAKGDTFERWQNIDILDDKQVPATPKDDFQQKDVFRYSVFAVVLTFIVLILWPVLTLPAGLFSKSFLITFASSPSFRKSKCAVEGYFKFWVILSMIWATTASIVATFLPLVEARKELMRILKLSLCQNVGRPGSAIASSAVSMTSTTN